MNSSVQRRGNCNESLRSVSGYCSRSRRRETWVDPAQRQIDFSDLRHIHDLTARLVSHEYVNEGLGAIGLFLHDSPRSAGY